MVFPAPHLSNLLLFFKGLIQGLSVVHIGGIVSQMQGKSWNKVPSRQTSAYRAVKSICNPSAISFQLYDTYVGRQDKL